MNSLEAVQRVRPRLSRAAGGRRESTVSVVILCYNYGGFLEAAVRSALAQGGARMEIIVVDDHSSDGSLPVALDLAARDRRITVVSNEFNSGPVHTFNRGLAMARGEFVIRLDADDLLTPGSVERALSVFNAYPSVGLVYGHPLHFKGNVLPEPRTSPRKWTVWPGRTWLEERCASGVNVITAPEAAMRMSTVRKTGGQKSLRHTHDMEMWLRLAALSDVAYIHGADQAWHREHAGSLSASEVDEVTDLVGRREAFEVLFSGPVGDMPCSSAWRDLAFRALARESVARARRELDLGRGDSEEFRVYMDIARDLVADPSGLPGWGGLERRLSGARPWAASLVSASSRLERRVKAKTAEYRWHHSGVF